MATRAESAPASAQGRAAVPTKGVSAAIGGPASVGTLATGSAAWAGKDDPIPAARTRLVAAGVHGTLAIHPETCPGHGISVPPPRRVAINNDCNPSTVVSGSPATERSGSSPSHCACRADSAACVVPTTGRSPSASSTRTVSAATEAGWYSPGESRSARPTAPARASSPARTGPGSRPGSRSGRSAAAESWPRKASGSEVAGDAPSLRSTSRCTAPSSRDTTSSPIRHVGSKAAAT